MSVALNDLPKASLEAFSMIYCFPLGFTLRLGNHEKRPDDCEIYHSVTAADFEE